MKTLDLVLKKKWYDMIDSGVKTEEYREIKPFWANRLLYHSPLGEKAYWQSVLEKARALVKEHPNCYNLQNLLIKNMGTRGYEIVTFHLGYAKDRPSMTFELDKIEIGEGRSEWGAEAGEMYFVIKLGKRLS